ncbi:MAG: bifunctional hydroxymethylpyrimidine kinase/phosphomethylpyrimidine kinase [Chloroflexi bacterium]|nr:bifunctional hydroxymethylpyrimidine kinase/phosphomethylpyrimidine kinase [Chloroflexota bacterium]
MKTALTIAGSDSGGGAGIQADLKTFAAFGVYGASAITGVTAQNTVGVRAVELMTPAMVDAQIAAVLDDIGADAVKTGMLGSADIITVVASALRRFQVEQLVVDPVMVAKSGDRLLAEPAVAALRDRLLPLTLVLTPNLPEAEALLGRTVRDLDDMPSAARDLLELGPRYVVLKGGHLPGSEVVDLLVGGRLAVELRAPRIDTRHTHGTGCTYAAAIAAMLARGADVPEAVRAAYDYLQGAIAAAEPIGAGHGPVNHFHRGVLASDLDR